MAVTRSPFSNQGDNSGVNLYGGPSKSTSTTVARGLGLLSGPNIKAPKVSSGKVKSTIDEEQAKLDRAYTTALAKIAASTTMNDKEKNKQRKRLRDTYEFGGAAKSKPIFGDVGTNIAKSIIDIPKQSIKTTLKTTGDIGRTFQSGLAELDDFLTTKLGAGGRVAGAVAGNPISLIRQAVDFIPKLENQQDKGPVKASWSEFVAQAKDKEFKPIQSGNKIFDGITDFGLDVVTDATTFMGVGPVSYVGKAGRAELAVKFGTEAMMKKYPQLAGKLDDIMRYGVSAVPRDVRVAEGIGFGVRFAGQIVPKTEVLARTVSGKYGAASVRAGVGDIIEKAGLKATRAKMTPASRKGLVMKSIGRGKGLSDDVVVQEIANYTASKAGRAWKAATYRANIEGIRETLKAVGDAGPSVSARVTQLVENPKLMATEPDAQIREWAGQFAGWQDQLRNQTNDVYRKFNLDYSARVNDIGFVDDFIHHRITPEALSWIYGKDTQAKAARFFKDADMMQAELGASSGSAMYRRIRKPVVDENGVLQKSKFMGRDVEVGDIKEINRIFQDVTGLTDVKFFDDDITAIADSYAYSMAAARGREAVVRRLMDYGPNIAQVVNLKVVPDKELVSQLNNSHTNLMQVRRQLIRKVNKGRDTAKMKAEEAVKFASRVLDSKDADYERLTREVAGVQAQIARIETELSTAFVTAASKGEAQRGAFLEVHKAMIEELHTLKNAVAQGRINEVVAYDILKGVYMDVFPDAKRVPKSASRLLEAINRANGIKDPYEVKELTKRLTSLQKQLKESPPVNPEDLNDMLDIEQELVRRIDGFETLSEVKMQADYAEDGLLFGVMDDLVERPFDPNLDPVARVISTRPLVRGGTGMTPDELAAARNAALTDPEGVAVHAIPTDEVIDMRDPESFYDFWEPQGGIGEAISYSMRQAGLDEDNIFAGVWNDLIDGEAFDPMFEQIYPEMADIMEFISIQHTRKFDEAIVDDELNVALLDNLQDMFADLAGASNLENSDMVAQQMMDDFLRAMVEEGMGNTGKPVLFPSKSIFGADNEAAEGAYSLLLPDRYKYSKRYGKENIDDVMLEGESSPVFLTAGDDFVRSITDGDYHTAAIDAVESLDNLGQSVSALQSQLESNSIIQQNIKQTAGSIGGKKSQGSRRMRMAEKAYQEYLDTGLVDVVQNGKKVKVTREKAIEVITKSEQKATAAVLKLEGDIARATDAKIAPLVKRKAQQEQRVVSLFNQRKVIERWNDATGDALRADVDLLKTSIATNPPAGYSGTNSRIWSDNVTTRLNNITNLGDSAVGKAWDRVATQLGADEAQLAMLESVEIPESIMKRAAVMQGLEGGQVVDDIIQGWEVLKGLNIQIPPEMADIMLPNIQKLKNRAEWGAIRKAYADYNTAFKIYATMSPGFVVRNAMSATFMNHVAGVSVESMAEGIKASVAYRRFGPEEWLGPKGLNITDVAVREQYETALRSVLATGRGISQDFASPNVAGGWAEKVLNNRLTRGLANANDMTENLVRFPMALDTLKRGQSFDEAVYRISRYHFNYSDLSQFDESVKQFIPFWIFMSRNLPLQWTEQLLRPSAYARWESAKERNPVAEDVTLPTWLRETGPLGLAGSWVLNPDLPMTRISETGSGMLSINKLLGQMNPVVKIIPEIIANKQSGLDIPFNDNWEESKGVSKAIAALADTLGIESVGRKTEDGGYALNPKVDYFAGNLAPPIGTAQRLSGGRLGGKPSYEERTLSSWLTWLGIPVRNVGEQQQRGAVIGKQFDIADAVKELVKQGKIEKNK